MTTSDTVRITDSIALAPVLPENAKNLQELMSVVYPPPYQHLWKDNCSFYLNKFYSISNILSELAEPETAYYFVLLETKPIGNLRICYHSKLIDRPDAKASKLNRIYLEQSVHGRGIGQSLLNWTEAQCRSRGDEILWLEAMDSQSQALNFYTSNGFKVCGSMRLDFEIMLPEFRGMKRLYKRL